MLRFFLNFLFLRFEGFSAVHDSDPNIEAKKSKAALQAITVEPSAERDGQDHINPLQTEIRQMTALQVIQLSNPCHAIQVS